MNLLKSNNIEDEILGWRIAYESGELESYVPIMKAYRSKVNRHSSANGYILRFDDLILQLGNLYTTKLVEEDIARNLILNKFILLDYRK